MLLTGLGWEQGIVLETRQQETKQETAVVGGQRLALAISSERFCIGYRPPGGASLLPCPEGVSGLSGYQCSECLQRAMNLPCLRCVGDYCRNPARREHCVVADNHALYLAAFSDTEIKVGVARWTRRQERVAEQGARAGIIIARDDGQMIRRHEAQIRALGIPDRLSVNRKLRALLQEPEEDLLSVLQQCADGLRRRMHAPWIDPEVVEIPEQPRPAVVPRLLNPAGLTIAGEVVASWGQLLLIADDNQELIAIDSAALVGHEIKELPLGATSSYQPALFPTLAS